MTNLEDEPYANEYQQQAVEFLHRRTKITAVSAQANSTIVAYLTRQRMSDKHPELGPYEIDGISPLPDCSEFECKVTLTADWTEVDFDDADDTNK